MIGFGELRKFSTQWQIDIVAVERAYVIDWVVKGIFDHAALARVLVLRGGAALRYAHCADYPIAQDPEFLAIQPMDDRPARDVADIPRIANPPVDPAGLLRDAIPSGTLRDLLAQALRAAADASGGLKFSLIDLERGGGKIEYTGPLGRRSAAQPRITLSILQGQTRLDPAHLPLIHPFSDNCAATVSAIALEEFAAERIAALGQKPRARDVYDVWFVLTHAHDKINAARAHTLAREIANGKNISPPHMDSPFDPTHRAILERAWNSALSEVRGRPSFVQVEGDLRDALKIFVEG